MEKNELFEKISEIARPIVDEMDLELIDIIIQSRKKDTHIQILSDRHNGGITIDECAALNKRIGEEMEKENIVPSSYTLEISSPGLDRPLIKREDFLRVVGCEVRIHLSSPVDGKVEYAGNINEVNKENMIIDNGEKKIAIPLGSIHVGKQIIK